MGLPKLITDQVSKRLSDEDVVSLSVLLLISVIDSKTLSRDTKVRSKITPHSIFALAEKHLSIKERVDFVNYLTKNLQGRM